jgi:GntR family transcriptional regulator
VRGDGVAGAGDGDVGEQQPGDALAFAGRGGGVVPDRGQFRVSYIPAELAEGTPIAQSTAITDAWPAALTIYLGKQVRLASSQVTARHPNHEEAAALALPSDAAVLVREDIYEGRRGSPVDFTRTVWPGDTTRLVIGD